MCWIFTWLIFIMCHYVTVAWHSASFCLDSTLYGEVHQCQIYVPYPRVARAWVGMAMLSRCIFCHPQCNWQLHFCERLGQDQIVKHWRCLWSWDIGLSNMIQAWATQVQMHPWRASLLSAHCSGHDRASDSINDFSIFSRSCISAMFLGCFQR